MKTEQNQLLAKEKEYLNVEANMGVESVSSANLALNVGLGFERWRKILNVEVVSSVDLATHSSNSVSLFNKSLFPSSINKGSPPFRRHTNTTYLLFSFSFVLSFLFLSISSLDILGIFALKSFLTSSKILNFI